MSEFLLVDANILTLDDTAPRVDALLWRDGKIVAVGREAEVRAQATDADIQDLGGRTVVPGFNDAHIHLAALGERETALDLSGMNLSQIVEAVREKHVQLPPGEHIQGYNWDYPACPDPHRRHLDAVAPDRVVVLFQFSGHGGWLNSAALELLKINRETPDWGMGGADRDPDGELNGILREPGQAPGRMRLYRKELFNWRRAEQHIRAALPRLAEHGITSVQDNTWFPWNMRALQNVYRSGDLTCRVNCWSPGFLPPFEWLFILKRFRDEWYERGPRKYFLDGAFSSHTAWLKEPYADRPDSTGSGKDAESIVPYLRRAQRERRQIACHAIGDAATAAYVEAVARVAGKEAAPLRHRIEHGQLIDPEDMERIARLGMVVAAQPHAAATPEKDAGLLGAERANRSYAYRSMLDAGVHLAFSSDYPGEATYDPLYGIHLAVNRQGGEAITPMEALQCYTTGSAFAEFKESRKGKLAPGYVPDFVVLSDDPTLVDPQGIKDIRVDMTVVDGRRVYTREGHGPSRGSAPKTRRAPASSTRR